MSQTMLRREIRQRLAEWKNSPYFGEEVAGELAALTDEAEIRDRFGGDLSFGTGGVRGLMGAGPNRMNRFVVRRISASLADVIWEEGVVAVRRGVVVAYDSRRCSRDFALETAGVLAARGIHVYLFDGPRPTPELSFAVRRLRAAAGVVITASHNSREYNGYKVYGGDGGQLTPRTAGRIARRYDARTRWEIVCAGEEEARRCGLLTTVRPELDGEYIDAVRGELLNPALAQTCGGRLALRYTPLHGAAGATALALLRSAGFTKTQTVAAQAAADGDFPTVAIPNPEDDEVFTVGLAEAEAAGDDLLLANDPDGDRLGVYCRDRHGVYCRLSGNEVGALLLDHRLARLKERGELPTEGVVVQSVVSTMLTRRMAAAYGLTVKETPVGFKFIGERISRLERQGRGRFVFGFEQSLGYLSGSYCRDKDGLLAAVLVAEAALYQKVERGQTLVDRLAELGAEYGWFADGRLTLDGDRVQQADWMRTLRQAAFTELGGLPVVSVNDYAASTATEGGRVRPLEFPPCELLGWDLGDRGFVMARPSGTEPQLRVYFCIGGSSEAEAAAALARVKADFPLQP